jgi:arabinose-5-phosphate isomerase
MTRSPLTVGHTARMEEAVALMRARKISELPVIDEVGRPVGLLDITDLIGAEEAATHTGQHVPPAARNRASA